MIGSLCSESDAARGRRSGMGVLALLIGLTLLLAACSPAGGGGTETACEYGSGTYGSCVYGS